MNKFSLGIKAVVFKTTYLKACHVTLDLTRTSMNIHSLHCSSIHWPQPQVS